MSKKKDGKNTSTGRDKYTNTMQTETYRQQMAVRSIIFPFLSVVRLKTGRKKDPSNKNKSRYGQIKPLVHRK